MRPHTGEDSQHALRLYRQMLWSRSVELLISTLWNEGHISGEMHLSTGEEAVAVGVVDHLVDGDAMALDHRGTAPLLARGIPASDIVHECLGLDSGLCGGHGGHMHLFSQNHLTASSGIVGAAGPTAVGFALSARRLRPRAVSVAFFGEGAVNQGMLMESFNAAAAWKLPVLFLCRDDDWAISTISSALTGGDLRSRSHGFGLAYTEVDGLDVEAVWKAAGAAIRALREGSAAQFLHARVVHLDGHFLGDPLLAAARRPLRDGVRLTASALRQALKPGGTMNAKAGALRGLAELTVHSRTTHNTELDPIAIHRAALLERGVDVTSEEEEVYQDLNRLETDARQAISAASELRGRS